ERSCGKGRPRHRRQPGGWRRHSERAGRRGRGGRRQLPEERGTRGGGRRRHPRSRRQGRRPSGGRDRRGRRKGDGPEDGRRVWPRGRAREQRAPRLQVRPRRAQGLRERGVGRLLAAARGAQGCFALLAGGGARDGGGGRGQDLEHPLQPHKQPRRPLPRLHDRQKRPARLLPQPGRRARAPQHNGQHGRRRPHRRDGRERPHHRGGPPTGRRLDTPAPPRHPGGPRARRPHVRLTVVGLRDRTVHHLRRRAGDGL
ncbi:MAG: 3-oxoacyl-[acyl-carrier protein] reductase, partial [uncultured Rubrobacteraceae bacterium]